MILEFRLGLYFLLLLFMLGCESKQKNIWDELTSVESEEVSVVSFNKVPPITAPEGMVWVPSGKFNQGAIDSDQMARSNERPAHEVFVDGFFMDVHEVTNAQFAKFVEDTGYVTMAERPIDWEEMKKQLPKGTLKPHDSILKPGSLVFKKTKTSVPNLYDYSQWWEWRIGADWKHPDGPDSDIVGKEDHPVVHIAFEDAMSYCSWAGKRLPTEAEWEYAARGGCEQTIFFWGNDLGQLSSFVNSWEGEFPLNNSRTDGYEKRAPVMRYPKNGFGLYDMAGNVWEWTQDWYDTDYYSKLQGKQEIIKNPNGASQPFNASNPLAKEKVIKGGSFLCSDSYCASYRISARMASSPDSSIEHLGFRTVLSSDIKNKR